MLWTGFCRRSSLFDPPQSQAPYLGSRRFRRTRTGCRQPDPINYAEHDGWVSLFDGKTLNGWSGDQNWRVEDGAIAIEPELRASGLALFTSDLAEGGEVTNFEMKFEMKGTGAINGGVQYRSWIQPPPQANNETPPPRVFTVHRPQRAPRGISAGCGERSAMGIWAPRNTISTPGNTVPVPAPGEQARGRARIAWRGQSGTHRDGQEPLRLVALLGDQSTIDSWFKPNDWNEAHIIALGNNMTHILNGHVMSVLFDEDSTKFNGSGHIGIEVESTGKLFVRNIWLRRL